MSHHLWSGGSFFLWGRELGRTVHYCGSAGHRGNAVDRGDHIISQGTDVVEYDGQDGTGVFGHGKIPRKSDVLRSVPEWQDALVSRPV